MNKIDKALVVGTQFFTDPTSVGSQSITRVLSSIGIRTGYISHPISLIHFLTSNNHNNFGERYANAFRGGSHDDEIWHWNPLSVFPFSNKFPFNNALNEILWKSSLRLEFRRTLRRAGFNEVDLLFFSCISRLKPVLDMVRHDRFYFRISDYNFKDALSYDNIYRDEYISRCDRVLVSSSVYCEELRREYPDSADKFRFMPNGVELGKFDGCSMEIPAEYSGINAPIILYLGAIRYWFDFDFFEHAARSLPDYHFCIMGPIGDGNNARVDQLTEHRNISYLGTKKSNEIAPYIKHASVGLIPFIRDRMIDRVNPIKLYEYHHFGLPAVSRKWLELERLDSPAMLYESKSEFIDMIRSSVELKANHRQNLIKWAEKYTWENIVREYILNQ